MARLGALLVLLGSASACTTPPTPSPQEKMPPLQFTISARAEFKTGEPVLLRMALRNAGDRPILVNKFFRINSDTSLRKHREVVVTVVNEKGLVLPFQRKINPVRSHNEFVLLDPGASVEDEQNLGRFFDMSAPGKYLVQARYSNLQDPERNTWGQEPFKGELVSNSIVLKIHP